MTQQSQKIYKLSDPIMMTRCVEVSDITEYHRQVADDLILTVIETNAPGLAANQIGHPVRMVAIVMGDGRVVVMVNPVIIRGTGPTDQYYEGCMSDPTRRFRTVRCSQITVEYETLDGIVKTVKCEGMLSVIIQHKIDHLDGIV
jgi:peptide deformylase